MVLDEVKKLGGCISSEKREGRGEGREGGGGVGERGEEGKEEEKERRRRRKRRRKNHVLRADRQPFPNSISPVIGPYPAAKSILIIYSFGIVNKPEMLGNRLRA